MTDAIELSRPIPTKGTIRVSKFATLTSARAARNASEATNFKFSSEIRTQPARVHMSTSNASFAVAKSPV